MEFVTILHRLWLRRIFVAAGLAAALLVGLMTAYQTSLFPPGLKSRHYHVGLATARILIDTPSSQVVDVDPAGIDAISPRANLLANLMTSSQVKSLIAKNAGIKVDRLTAIAPSDGAPPVPTLLSQEATKSAHPSSDYRLNIYSGDLPIIQVQAQAPDAEQAARLANASVVSLGSYLKSVATAQNVPQRKQIVVSSMGSAQARDVTRGPRRIYGLLAAMFVFGLVCAGIIVAEGLARGWRKAAAIEAV